MLNIGRIRKSRYRTSCLLSEPKCALGLAAFAVLLSAGLPAVAAPAYPPAEPTKIVYPTGDPAIDPLEIQAAVDGTQGPLHDYGPAGPGGRILLKATNTTGRRTAFDLGQHGHEAACSPPAPCKGSIVIGSTGHDVTIVGEVDAQGEPATEVIDGWIPFYCIAAVKFNISNVKLSVGVHGSGVTGYGIYLAASAGATIHNCRIHVYQVLDFWVGAIFVRFAPYWDGLPSAPFPDPNASILITNNKVFIDNPTAGSGWMFGMALGYGNFTGFHPGLHAASNPFVFIDNNEVEIHTDTPDYWISGLATHGGTSNTVISNNTFAGNTTNHAMNFWIDWDINGTPLYASLDVASNDLSQLRDDSGYYVWIDPHIRGTTFMHNTYGPGFNPELQFGAGVYVSAAAGNQFINEDFLGNYPGWSSGNGCYILDVGSQENEVVGLKNGLPAVGFDVCDQVLDLNQQLSGTTTNRIPGSVKCEKIDSSFVFAEQAMAAASAEERAARWQMLEWSRRR